MVPPAPPPLEGRVAAFVAERYPHALAPALDAFRHAAAGEATAPDAAAIDALRVPLRHALGRALPRPPARALPETTPAVTAPPRPGQAADDRLGAGAGFLGREAL